MNTCLWMNCLDPQTPYQLFENLGSMIRRFQPSNPDCQRPVVFLCIGTPEIPGDSLGPSIGTKLKKLLNIPVYGTLKHPVHALNLKNTIRCIYSDYVNPLIIVIDAAIGNEFQKGFITLKKGALKPGSGLGKRLPAIGHIQITGVFWSLYDRQAQELVCRYTDCIFKSLEFL